MEIIILKNQSAVDIFCLISKTWLLFAVDLQFKNSIKH